MNNNQESEYQSEQIEESKDCKYKDEIIRLKTDSLDNEIKKSEIIKNKLSDSKYLSNFSYIIKSESIEISQISEEISKCNLSNDTSSEYMLCEYTNHSSITITEFLNKKASELDSKIVFRIILDFHITLQESLEELYEKTKIVHNKIDETNIMISEEQIPIIKNFKEAKIMEPDEKIDDTNEVARSFDSYSLIKTLLKIVTNLSIKDDLVEYIEVLEKMMNSEVSERSINEIKQL